MASRGFWTGWVAFAGILMVVIGVLNFFQGLIAIIRDKYYVLAPQQVIVFDVTTWGWITLFLGILVAFAGAGLLAAKSWARWFTIVVAVFGLVEQLGFIGSSQYTLWSLLVLAMTVLVLYALIVRWGDVRQDIDATL